MEHFKPHSPDPLIKKEADQALAKFGHLNYLVDKLNEFDANQSIVANPGGGQSLATLLILGLNEVSTATNGDSVILPCLNAICQCNNGCGPIGPVVIKNTGPGSLTVFPCVGESIDNLPINTPVTVLSGQSLFLSDTDCSNWATYGNTSVVPPGAVTSVTGCNVNNADPANPVIDPVLVALVSPTEALTGDGCNTPLSVCIDNITIVKDPGTGCLQVGTIPPTPASVGYAEYVQHTQGTNVSVAPGTAIEYLTDNPLGVFNTLGITTGTGPGAIGTAFLLPIGVYVVDYENSADAAWSLAIYKNTVAFAGPYAIDTNTISGASTATTWIHGRAIVDASLAPTYIIISPVTGTQAIPTAGTAAGEFIARLTILKVA